MATDDAPRRGLPRWLEAPLALAALVAALPVLLAAGLAVRLTSRGPAIFRQERVGRDGRPFVLYKLRTMRHDTESAGQVTAAGDARVTPVGRLLRRTKLDEVPQLWNVVRGDLALVGPRPEVPAYVDRDDPELGRLWQRVLSVRPGLTDPVTLRLRDEEGLLRRLVERSAASDLDRAYRRHVQPWKLRGYVSYLERRTSWTDLRCLVATALPFAAPSPLRADELLPGESTENPEAT